MRLTVWRVLAGLLVLGLAACDMPAPQRIPDPTVAPKTISLIPVASPLPAPSHMPTRLPTVTKTSAPTVSRTAVAAESGPALVAERFYSPWDQVTALRWTPNGLQLAVAAGEDIHLYATAGFTEQAMLPLGVWVSQIAFDPSCISKEGEACLALAARDGTLQFWDVLGSERLASWTAHRKSATSLSFSPDGSTLATAGNDAMVRLWDLTAYHATGLSAIPQRAEMIGGAFAVPAVRISPEGKLVASVDTQAIRLRDPETQRLVRTLRTAESVFNIEFSPDGRWLAAGELDNTVRLWDVANGELLAIFSAQGLPGGGLRPFIWSLAFSPDGHLLAAGSSDGFIRLWSLEEGLLVVGWLAHARAVTALEFQSNTGVLASGGLDAALRLWRIGDE